MKNKSPAFQFYPKDWLADPDVMCMTMAERGVYITLLCYLWESEGKMELDQIKKLLKGHKRALLSLENVLVKFQIRSNMVTHKRLTKERKKQQEYSDNRREAGKKGAKKRWHSHSLAMNLPLAKNGIASSSAIATAERGVDPQVFDLYKRFHNNQQTASPTVNERIHLTNALKIRTPDEWQPFIDNYTESVKNGGRRKSIKWFFGEDYIKFEKAAKEIEEYRTAGNGELMAYCTKCDNLLFFQNMAHLRSSSSCCGVDLKATNK